MLDANIARAKHDYKAAAALLTKAALAEDALNYDEPPDWYLPPRESLGAVLFLDGRAKEAEAAFRRGTEAAPQKSTRAVRAGGVPSRARQNRRGSCRPQGV